MIRYRRFRHPITAALSAVAFGVGSLPAGAQALRQSPREEVARPSLSETPAIGAPVMAIVSIRDQKVSLYDANGGALRAGVSSGQTGYETPVGIYSILQKNREHYSNLYDDASMPFMQRITWSGIALHAGVLPGRPASHGCVRLPHSYAEQIFDMTKMGMRVIVARNDIAPVDISHALLPKPKPIGDVAFATPTAYEPEGSSADRASPLLPDVRAWPQRQAQIEALRAAAKVKDADASAASAETDKLKRVVKARSTERGKALKAMRIVEAGKRKLDERSARADKALASAKSPADVKNAEETRAKVTAAITEAAAKMVAATSLVQAAEQELQRATEAAAAAETVKNATVKLAQEAERKTFPVSVFVSLKSKRLYVRQGYAPVLDVPVEIANPETPIGTHVYTAVEYLGQGDDVKWTAVAVKGRQPGEADGDPSRRQRNGAPETLPPVTDAAEAKAALDRVTIPPDVAARMAEFVWPGTSLIVSDEEMSKETGKATDFVVLISGEPQGGIKKRKRQPPPDNFYPYDSYSYDSYYSDRPRRRYKSNPFFSFW